MARGMFGRLFSQRYISWLWGTTLGSSSDELANPDRCDSKNDTRSAPSMVAWAQLGVLGIGGLWMGWLKCGLGSVGRHSGAVDWLTGGGLCQRRELGGLRMGMAKVCFGEWGRHF